MNETSGILYLTLFAFDLVDLFVPYIWHWQTPIVRQTYDIPEKSYPKISHSLSTNMDLGYSVILIPTAAYTTAILRKTNNKYQNWARVEGHSLRSRANSSTTQRWIGWTIRTSSIGLGKNKRIHLTKRCIFWTNMER